VGDVSPDGREVRRRVTLDPATTKGGRRGEVFLPARLIPKLRAFLAWKAAHGEAFTTESPFFVSGQGRRLSPWAAQWRFAWWQRRAAFDRRYNFHCMRHSSITNVYRATRDLFLAQRSARHASPLTTVIYTHPADEELAAGVRDLPC
jgi:site-specific recombinase XerC